MRIEWNRVSKVADDISQTIGRTPLVNLRRIPRSEGIEAKILVKLEYMNPTGSLKDRIYYEMIKSAIQRGDLRAGMEILEASTGNAGISCAFVGTTLGHKVTVVMPSGMSQERQKMIRAYGAEDSRAEKSKPWEVLGARAVQQPRQRGGSL